MVSPLIIRFAPATVYRYIHYTETSWHPTSGCRWEKLYFDVLIDMMLFEKLFYILLETSVNILLEILVNILLEILVNILLEILVNILLEILVNSMLVDCQ